MPVSKNCNPKETTTVQPLLVFPSPSTKVCSNIAIEFVPFHAAAYHLSPHCLAIPRRPLRNFSYRPSRRHRGLRSSRIEEVLPEYQDWTRNENRGVQIGR